MSSFLLRIGKEAMAELWVRKKGIMMCRLCSVMFDMFSCSIWATKLRDRYCYLFVRSEL